MAMAGASSYRWDKLPPNLNVADYDVVILNFGAFEDTELAGGFPRDRLPTVESMTRLLFSPDAEIIAIGNPATLIGEPGDGTLPSFYDPRVRADYWMPFYIIVEEDTGTQYDVDDQAWAAYFDHVSAWQWIAADQPHPREYSSADDYLRPVTNQAHDISARFIPIATTRYPKMIALRVQVQAIRFGRMESDWSGMARGVPDTAQVVRESSPVFWLPTPDRVSGPEAIDTILRERYGIAQEARTPEWAMEYSLPAEVAITAEIAALEQERRELEQRITDARGRGLDAGRPRLLLYEKGKDVLEPIVRQTLRTLGARVDDPETEGIEDGRLFRDEGEAVLEIKGRNGPIKLEDVRQVVQWATDAKLKDGIVWKPVIVGNAYCDKPLGERGEVLAPPGAAAAKNGGVAVVTTAQLFEALRQSQAGTLDEARFWKTIFVTNGAVALDEPTAEHTADES